mmetsp:Transcript_6325/g.17664  ORF Transcript_6325/g.17664 Transcript_6325/m.17664 type:complete len:315 (+) Transcript_6325:401-1345(+)
MPAVPPGFPSGRSRSTPRRDDVSGLNAPSDKKAHWMGAAVKQSAIDAKRWFEKAARSGRIIPRCCDQRGILLHAGDEGGVASICPRAREFFQRAMEWDGGATRPYRDADDGLAILARRYLHRSSGEAKSEDVQEATLDPCPLDRTGSDVGVKARFQLAYAHFEERNYRIAWYSSCALGNRGDVVHRCVEDAAFNAMLCCGDKQLCLKAQEIFWAQLDKKVSASAKLEVEDRVYRVKTLVCVCRELRLLRDTCGGCGAAFEGKDRKFCRGCRTYCYFSRECQKMHWNRKENGHRQDCKGATELKRKLKEARTQAS